MKHFLTLADLSPETMRELLDLAVEIKADWRNGDGKPYLKNKVLGMVFQKPSLRTRVSFDVAMLQLGGNGLYLSPNEIRLGQRESTADVARVISRYVDVVMARVFSHQDVVELSEYASVPVINGLSDYAHPCQGMADFLTILEYKKEFKGRKLAYLGDGNNVATSLLFGAALLGMDFTIATPRGYELHPATWGIGQRLAAQSGATIVATHDPVEADDRSRRHLHRYLDLYGTGGRSSATAPDLPALPRGRGTCLHLRKKTSR